MYLFVLLALSSSPGGYPSPRLPVLAYCTSLTSLLFKDKEGHGLVMWPQAVQGRDFAQHISATEQGWVHFREPQKINNHAKADLFWSGSDSCSERWVLASPSFNGELTQRSRQAPDRTIWPGIKTYFKLCLLCISFKGSLLCDETLHLQGFNKLPKQGNYKIAGT